MIDRYLISLLYSEVFRNRFVHLHIYTKILPKPPPNRSSLVNYQLFIIDLFPKLFFLYFLSVDLIDQSVVSVNNLIEIRAPLIRKIPEILLIVQEENNDP